jgi:hypothetical protein
VAKFRPRKKKLESKSYFSGWIWAKIRQEENYGETIMKTCDGLLAVRVASSDGWYIWRQKWKGRNVECWRFPTKDRHVLCCRKWGRHKNISHVVGREGTPLSSQNGGFSWFQRVRTTVEVNAFVPLFGNITRTSHDQWSNRFLGFDPILWCSQSGDNPQQDLAKFG